jgi:hypothetical protein
MENGQKKMEGMEMGLRNSQLWSLAWTLDGTRRWMVRGGDAMAMGMVSLQLEETSVFALPSDICCLSLSFSVSWLMAVDILSHVTTSYPFIQSIQPSPDVGPKVPTLEACIAVTLCRCLGLL